MPFLELKPEKVTDIVNQKKAISDLVTFLNDYPRTSKKAALLHGPSGVGKTFSVYAIASDLDYEIVEVTADQKRNKDAMESIIKASTSGSIFGKKKLILVDELGSFGAGDRGGLAQIQKLIKTAKVPVVMITIDMWDPKLKYIRYYCKQIGFSKLRYTQIRSFLNKLLEEKGIEYDPLVTEFISKNVGGDLRAALNDLQMVATGKKNLTEKDLSLLPERYSKETIFTALQKLFRTDNFREAVTSLDNLSMDFGLSMLWIAENIPRQYKTPEEVAKAYDFISRAEIFMSRIRRRQDWSFLKYARILSTAGVAFSKKGKNHSFVRYQSPSKISKFIETKTFRNRVSSISGKISIHTHTSKKVAKDYISVFKTIIKNKPKQAKKIQEFLELDKKEMDFLKGKSK